MRWWAVAAGGSRGTSARLAGCGALATLARFGLVLGAVAGVATVTLTSRASRAQSDDHAVADALLKPLAPSPVTADAVDRARTALEQATRLRAAGDEAHAKAADGLAREWAETARDLTLAVAAEKLADDSKRQAMQSQAQLERTRALVEESLARLGRLRAALDSAPAPSARAVEVHDGDPGPRLPAKAQAAATGSTP